MLSIQNLRNKAGLFITITIGLALVAFVLSDFLSPGKSMFSQNTDVVAEINGQEIKVQTYFDLQKQMETNYQSNGATIDENTRDMIAAQSWDQLIRQELLQQEYVKLGLGVNIEEHGIIGITPEELKDMIVGNNVDPQVQQIFKNQETGAYDKALAINFLQNMGKDPERKQIWLNIEKQLIENKLASKYTALISQGMYTTTAEATVMANDKNSKVDLKFISLQYYALPDSTFKPTEEELKKYLSEHKEEFKQEDARDIEYVSFPIYPSNDDVMATQNFIVGLIEDFKTTEDDEAFVNSNSSESFDSRFYKKGELTAQVDTFAFGGKKGDVTSPYFDGQTIKISKISKKEMLSDSVRARHILVKSGDAEKTADSLKNLIEGGKDFMMVAFQHSEDPGSKTKGGDLGWFKQGMMVRPFNDTCFFGKTGKIYKVYSQFGVHLVEILEKSKTTQMVQVATITAKIEASTATRSKVYSEASKFAGENNTMALLTKTIENTKTIDKRVANDLKSSDRSIPGLQQARQIIRWAYESDEGQVSNVFDCANSFVVAYVKKIKEKGYADVEAVKSQLEASVIKQKKAKKILSDFEKAGTCATIEELASKVTGVSVQEATGVSFGSSAVPNIGYEPKIAGVATQLEIGKLSKPIEGNNGVYVLVSIRADNNPVTEANQEKDQSLRMLKSRTGYFSIMNLKESANINDNRLKFE